MKIGVRAHDFGRHAPDALAGLVKAAGFETVQLAPHKALTGVDGMDDVHAACLDTARAAFAQAGVAIDVLGCYVEPASPDEAERARSVDLFVRGLRHAKRLGAPVVATETTRYSGDEAGREARYQLLLGSVRRMAREAEPLGVTVGIEPVALHTLNSARLARRLLDEVASPALGIVFDPVNLLTRDNLNRQDEIWDACFALLGEHICAVHLKDVDESLEWQSIGAGLVHYDRIFDWLSQLNKNLPLLREEAKPESAQPDIHAIRRFLSRF